ncbi:MAG TPA: DUF3592 domain-containing protein [Steroidobacteraceae bacterium]|nr:DUF3592 domain-containing protein [Steroidobacteraceae bacterium]
MNPAESESPRPALQQPSASPRLVDGRGRPVVILSGPPSGRARTVLHGFGALLLLTGLIQLVPGVWDLAAMLRVETGGLRTSGQVVALQGLKDVKGFTSLYPVVRFTTATGASVQFRDRLTGSFPIGTRVPVMYRAEAPADTATIRRPVMNWVHGAAFGTVGLLLAALGIRLLFV